MHFRLLFGVAPLALCAVASAQVKLGSIDLYFVGLGSDDGAFEWSTGPHGSGVDVFTYCFSQNNYFDPSENPQVFDIWSIAGATPSSIDASGMLSTNLQPGLTSTHFLEAAAEAQSYGTPDLSGTSAAHNADIHNTESFGDASWDGHDFGSFLYLEQANPSSYAYGGQPQGYIIPPGGPNFTPGPFSALPMGVSLIGMAVRRRKRA